MKNYFSTILVFLHFLCLAQDNLGSATLFSRNSYKTIEDSIVSKFDKNPKIAYIYSKAYLLKSIALNDSLEKARAYKFLSITAEDDLKKLKYVDTLIFHTRQFNSEEYPASGYFLKAELLYGLNKYNESLENALIANDYLKKYGDSFIKHLVKNYIASILSRFGEYEKAIENYLYSLDYFKENSQNYYERTLFGLSESYLDKGDSKLAENYYRIGLKESKDSKNYGYFILMKGRLAYQNGQYSIAVNDLSESLNLIKKQNDWANVALNHYWLGLALERLGEKQQAFNQFTLVDSVFVKIKDVTPYLRYTWVKLKQHFNAQYDIEKELYYTNQLVKVDSVISANYKEQSEKITNKLVVPNLIDAKDVELSELMKSTYQNRTIAILLGLALLLALSLFFFFRKKSIARQRQYELVISKMKSSDESSSKSRNVNLNEELKLKIEQGLITFESEKGYLRNGITVGDLAKAIGTNRKYLSVYINSTQEKKFPDYINDLRIKYALKRFQTNEGNFRAWRMNAIAREIGFSSREYYVKAFKKYTNLNHVDYLVQLKKSLKKQPNS